MATNPKDLNSLIRAAFDAGVRHGTGYEEVAAIPPAESEIQFRAFLDDWNGDTWGPMQWLRARDAEPTLRGRGPRCIRGTRLIDHESGPCDPNCDFGKVDS